MRKLHPTFADSSSYRGKTQNEGRLTGRKSEDLRDSVLARDGYKCSYCDFYGKEWLSIGYIDEDSNNNLKSNLTTVCPMCNLILNAKVGCQIEGIVELYAKSAYDQNKIVQLTRKMRSEGKSDDVIRRVLGLEEKMPFKMNKKYLNGLYAFVTSWMGSVGDVEEALSHCYGKC